MTMRRFTQMPAGLGWDTARPAPAQRWHAQAPPQRRITGPGGMDTLRDVTPRSGCKGSCGCGGTCGAAAPREGIDRRMPHAPAHAFRPTTSHAPYAQPLSWPGSGPCPPWARCSERPMPSRTIPTVVPGPGRVEERCRWVQPPVCTSCEHRCFAVRYGPVTYREYPMERRAFYFTPVIWVCAPETLEGVNQILHACDCAVDADPTRGDRSICDDYREAARDDIEAGGPSYVLFNFFDYLRREPSADPRMLLCDSAPGPNSCGGEIAVLATPTPYVRIVPHPPF